jgi:hypothetical protein
MQPLQDLRVCCLVQVHHAIDWPASIWQLSYRSGTIQDPFILNGGHHPAACEAQKVEEVDVRMAPTQCKGDLECLLLIQGDQ